MGEVAKSAGECVARIRRLLVEARGRALQSVNAEMLAAYWHIGREIVEEEQRGGKRAGYGERLIRHLAERLTAEFGPGFGKRNLEYIREFYKTFADRAVGIAHTVCAQSPVSNGTPKERPKIRYAPSSESTERSTKAFRPNLSWSHYRSLMRIPDEGARSFYEIECSQARWSVRELERQVSSHLYERLARSRDKEGVLALAKKGHEVAEAADLVKDPYVVEFVGLPEATEWLESDLEGALIEHLKKFLLELGRDLFFVARQQRITIDGDSFYIDLVFYHRGLRAFLLIDVKTGRLTQQDIGQMLLYTGYYEEEMTREGENPPIGLILCASKNEAVVRYTLRSMRSRIFASRYQLHLPTEQELADELRRGRRALETQARIERAKD